MIDFLRRSTVARLVAIGAIALFTSGAQTRCSTGDMNDIPGDDDNADVPTFTTTLVLKNSAGAVKSAFLEDEPITFELSVRNRTSQPVEIDFRSGQQYDFFAFDSGSSEVVWSWSAAAMFTMAESTLTFAAGETKVFSVQHSFAERGSFEARGAVLFDGLQTNPQAPHELGSTLVPFTIN
jgi:hypothetical protein